MKIAIIYTVFTVLNLIGYTVGITFLPEDVAIHFNAAGVADGFGSPWVYVSLPAVSAVISAGIWAAFVTKSEKNRKILILTLALVGAFFVVLGWAFFGLVVQTPALGEKTDFPFALAIILPLSLLIMFFGNYMPRIKPNKLMGIRIPATLKSETVWVKTHRVGGFLFFGIGLVSAICSVIFSCVPGDLAFVSLIIFGVLLLAAVISVCVYASVLYNKEEKEKEYGIE